MRFAIGKISSNYGPMAQTFRMLASIEVDGKPVQYIIGNYEQFRDQIEETDHALFCFVPEDQFANFIPMSEVNVIMTQAIEQQRLRREKAQASQIVVDATA